MQKENAFKNAKKTIDFLAGEGLTFQEASEAVQMTRTLGYQNPRDALATHIDDEDKNTVAIHDGIRGSPNMTIINESGLYSLIFSSKLPSARKFKRWVTSEVLPAIRKAGRYMPDVDLQTIAHPPVHRRELTADDYITAAHLAADCLDERLPYVLGFLERGGFDIPKVEGFFPETKSKPRPPIVIDLDAFVRELIEGRELTSRGYLFTPEEFNQFCETRNVSPRIIRRRLYSAGYIEGKKEASGKLTYSVALWIDGIHQRRVIIKPQ